MELSAKRDTKRAKAFTLAFLILLLYAIPGFILDHRISLNGVVKETKIESLSVDGILSGAFQSELNDYIDEHFGGRNLFIRLRSQCMYSLFNESPNKNVVIGEDKYLFEPEYIYKELNIFPVCDDEYFEGLLNKLTLLDQKCAESNKELYIFVTPSKAHFCKDKIPNKYLELGSDGENNYQRFIRYMEQSGLKYFDSHKYIEEHEGEKQAPVFYSTGAHWSHPWGQACSKVFLEYIDTESKWDLSSLEQSIGTTENNEPIAPDTDLYNSLNLVVKPNNDVFYKSVLSITDEKDVPTVFMRGGSFLGQSLRALGECGAVHVSAHYENNYCFLNDYSESRTFSAFDSYEEFTDLDDYLSKSDIVILEVNEAAIPTMSWGFIDYLLEDQNVLNK